jgi:hypothetical protein
MKRLKFIFVITLTFLSIFSVVAQSKIENVIFITTDGLRWQEVFKGIDMEIVNNPKFNQGDSLGILKKYDASNIEDRRKKLMPFLWETIQHQGQIFGNRSYGCNVNVSNPHWFSYPGYSEIFTGNVDESINSNKYPPNPHTNFLEFLNKKTNFKGSVAAFGAWDAFDRILNESRSGFPVISGFDNCGGDNPDAEQQMLNTLKNDSYNFNVEALDVFTHYAALDYLKKKQPKALYISYGETDEFAHEGAYKSYLNSANKVDKWLGEIWNYIQSTPKYKNKTLMFITVDHGRGDGKNSEWTSHNSKINGSDQIWFAILGPTILPKGEVKENVQIFQKQFAQTITKLLGYTFTCEHPVANDFIDVLNQK